MRKPRPEDRGGAGAPLRSDRKTWQQNNLQSAGHNQAGQAISLRPREETVRADNPTDRLPAECLNGNCDIPSGDRNDDARHREQVVASATELR